MKEARISPPRVLVKVDLTDLNGKLLLPKATSKSRKCLSCMRVFLSRGNHNRLCYSCKTSDDSYGEEWRLNLNR